MTTVHKFYSVGDWEAVFIDGERVASNHQGRVSVLDYIEEGMEIEEAVETRVNLPEDDYEYPKTIEEIINDERYDYGL